MAISSTSYTSNGRNLKIVPIKVYISQPMNGKTDKEILLERERAVAEIERYFPNDQVKVLDSFKPENKRENPLAALASNLSLMACADIVYFVSGWKDARGCRIEHDCAVEYGIPRIEEDDNE